MSVFLWAFFFLLKLYNFAKNNSILDINKIRSDFPILNEKVYNKNLIYFDNGATSQKPKQVIDTISEYYSKYNANIHRGVHF